MSQWYLSKNGKAQGPLEESRIISMIEDGEVNHLDLVFAAGSSEWLPIAEVAEFNNVFKKEEPAAKTPEMDAEWVLLKKIKAKKGSQYSQLGPFSKDQVLDLIERGEIKFKDFAWKQGLDSWVPIGEVPEFADPLPSTPKVDTNIYEEPEVTQAGDEAMSLSSLIEIEHFEHEKTQVMSASDIPLNSAGFATETDFATPTSFISNEASVELDEKTPPPIDTISEVREETTADSQQRSEASNPDHETDADLWSLKPPETVSQVPKAKKSKPEKKKKVKAKAKKPAKKAKPQKKKNQRPIVDLAESPWPWVAAAGILFLSVIFLYMSFSGQSDEIAKNEEGIQQEKTNVLDHADPSQYADVNLGSSAGENLPEVENLDPALDPQLNMGSVGERVVSSAPKKKVVKKPKKKLASKAKEKKKPKKKISKRSKKPQVVFGSKKAKSFYKQRDRKVLFYSSLKVESLIAELEQKFKKTKKKKKTWKRFYSGWKKRAQKTMPRLVQKFPQRSNKYAYPKLLASFKKDHHLVLKYGEVYNAKVLGLRRPAGVPKNVKAIFTKYKKQAQGLGK